MCGTFIIVLEVFVSADANVYGTRRSQPLKFLHRYGRGSAVERFIAA